MHSKTRRSESKEEQVPKITQHPIKKAPRLKDSQKIEKLVPQSNNIDQAQQRIYRQILFKDTIYQIGEFCMFRETDKTSIVGKIISIKPPNLVLNQPFTMLEVRWFYSKADILHFVGKENIAKKQNSQNINFNLKNKLGISSDAEKKTIGDNEVFATNHTDNVYADSILSKCQVLPVHEYNDRLIACREQHNRLINDEPPLENVQEMDLKKTFFTRAVFDIIGQRFIPEFGSGNWDLHCQSCLKPLNPNIVHQKCVECNQYAHADCLVKQRIKGQNTKNLHKRIELKCEQCIKSLKLILQIEQQAQLEAIDTPKSKKN